jgi:fibro-slime domain-containing protein
MVQPNLDLSNGARTPLFFDGSGSGRREVDSKGIITCTPWDEYYTGPSEITSASTFADWYNNVAGVNSQITYDLNLSLNQATGTYVFDSANSAGFFPVDGLGFNEVMENHNYHFTTEAHIRFGYEAGQKFTFSGDDDLWIFVNGRLALDLGGMHSPITATIDFDAQASALAISPGNTYNMDIFHAERHTSASNFRVETNITCFETVKVPVIR